MSEEKFGSMPAGSDALDRRPCWVKFFCILQTRSGNLNVFLFFFSKKLVHVTSKSQMIYP